MKRRLQECLKLDRKFYKSDFAFIFMSLYSFLRRLENKKIISRKPHPAIPFILLGIEIVLLLFVGDSIFLRNFLYGLIIFNLVFAIVHWIVVIVLKKH